MKQYIRCVCVKIYTSVCVSCLTSEHLTFCGECTWPNKWTSNIRLRMYLAWQVNTFHLVENERDMTSEHLIFGGEWTWSDKWTTNNWWSMYLFQLHYGKYYWPAESHTCQIMYIIHQMLDVHLSDHVHSPPNVRCSLVQQRTFSTKG
jgi:hypothetical protein